MTRKSMARIICAVGLFLMLAISIRPSASGEIFRYSSRGKRDPFMPLIGPERPVTSGIEDITSIEDVNLEGIAIGGKGRKIVIINGEMLKENDAIGMMVVKKITKKTVTLLIGDKEYTLNISEEGGVKSEK